MPPGPTAPGPPTHALLPGLAVRGSGTGPQSDLTHGYNRLVGEESENCLSAGMCFGGMAPGRMDNHRVLEILNDPERP